MTVVVVVLLATAVVACLVSAVGVAAVRRPLDRLHFTGIATVLGTIPLTIAVAVHAGPSDTTVKAVVVGAVVLVTGPVLNQATGRAIVTRERGTVEGDGWELTR